MPALLSSPWQLTHLVSNIGCSWVFQPTPTMSVAATGAVLSRLARGVVPNSFDAPVANVPSKPGDTMVVLVRSSWQPPHMRASPGRPDTQTGSLNSDMPNWSTACMWIGTLAGISADHEPSAAT